LLPFLFATTSKEQEGREGKGEKIKDGASSLSLKFRHLSRFLDWS
jgi:hypothetical protein